MSSVDVFLLAVYPALSSGSIGGTNVFVIFGFVHLYLTVFQVVWKHRQISQECEDNKLEVMKLTQMINLQEEALLEINRNHETAIQRRNFLYVHNLEFT